jgi:hypothetical protein
MINILIGCGEVVYANWFVDTYTGDYGNWAICDTISGCGTDSNPIESFNKSIKKNVIQERISVLSFMKTKADVLFTLIGTQYHVKNGQLASRDNTNCLHTVRRLPRNTEVVRAAAAIVKHVQQSIALSRERVVAELKDEQERWCVNSRNFKYDPSKPLENVITVDKATKFVADLDESTSTYREGYMFRTMEEAAESLSQYHVVTIRHETNVVPLIPLASKKDNMIWKCTCYMFNRNGCVCMHVAAVSHAKGLYDAVREASQLLPVKKGRPKKT